MATAWSIPTAGGSCIPAREAIEKALDAISSVSDALSSARDHVQDRRDEDFDCFTVDGQPETMDSHEAEIIREHDDVLRRLALVMDEPEEIAA
ncbi:hypothetical protein [Roseomonas xinghualingensis]|uniref:hypothetical protein n=1 Tax=Roseomonas xinghualingensis TaxID=2986475 RepID=UPI0021F16E7A|nr:hypothetical protein [Roseomonas sp. SXEYE001]MCV4210280.1 hypothetical protein [Roseomonas sp. SXEYE001]